MSSGKLNTTITGKGQNVSQQIKCATLCALAIVLCVALSACAQPLESSESPSRVRIDALDPSGNPELPESSGASLPQNPIDFAALVEQNPDVYAWIYVPDTKVNDAILQYPLADNYYLVHDKYDNESATGAIYTQTANAKDFNDPVTVIYGHTFEENNELSDEMFGTLHYFEDAKFFDEHPVFYIYTPDRILTYKIVSAYEYDDRHIMNSFDFADEKVLQSYFNYVTHPTSLVANVHDDINLKAGESKIVQLSTCTRPANDSARYIVTGVLTDEQKTA